MEKRAESKLKLFQIQEKKKLLLARKELKNQGVDQSEIDWLLPLDL